MSPAAKVRAKQAVGASLPWIGFFLLGVSLDERRHKSIGIVATCVLAYALAGLVVDTARAYLARLAWRRRVDDRLGRETEPEEGGIVIRIERGRGDGESGPVA